MRSLKYVQLHINQGFTYIKPSWIKVDLRLWLKQNCVCVHMLHFWGLKDISEIYLHLLPEH